VAKGNEREEKQPPAVKKKVKQSLRSTAQAIKDFAKAIDSLAYTRSKWKVFEDFLDYTLLTLLCGNGTGRNKVY